MKSERFKSFTIIVILIAILAVAYIITFHVPQPILGASETRLQEGSGIATQTDKDGNEYSLDYYSDEVLVYVGASRDLALIKEKDLYEILRNTPSQRELNYGRDHFADDLLYEIRLHTNKGVLHIYVEKENSYWLRDGGGLFRYRIIDGDTLYRQITNALIDIERVIQSPPLDEQKEL